jgi:stage V sporulation protein S
MKPNVISVFTSSHPYPLAEEIADNIRQSGSIKLQAMGTGAVNQAVKAIRLACGYLSSDGIEITWQSELTDVVIRDAEWTAMRFTVKRRAA